MPTATVVGAEGAGATEGKTHTAAHRIRVRFAWQQAGRAHEALRSAWLRVASRAAGACLGAQFSRAFISLLLALSVASPASANYCESNEDTAAIIAFISSDGEYRDYLCGDATCTNEEIGTLIDIRAEAVNGKDVFVCLATPKRMGRNIHTAVLIRTPNEIYPEFVFFGSGIGPAKRAKNGFKDLLGTEIGDKGVATRTVSTWNGKHYIAKLVNRH